MQFDDVMIDFETGSTATNGVILSIGAVGFSLDGGMSDDGFYASISVESNLEIGRVFSESTLQWWMKQSPQAQRVWHEPKQHISDAFYAFNEWLNVNDKDACRRRKVWSNGADFDIPMAVSVYQQFGMEVPWEFWNHRCFRTFKSLPGAAMVPRPDVGIKHNALDDAIAQVKHAHAIYAHLFAQKDVVIA